MRTIGDKKKLLIICYYRKAKYEVKSLKTRSKIMKTNKRQAKIREISMGILQLLEVVHNSYLS